MIDKYGRWAAEMDYSSCPVDKLCVMDHIAKWIHEQGYEIEETTIDNVVMNIISFYNTELINSKREYYSIENDIVEDIKTFVKEHGGIELYDYWD